MQLVGQFDSPFVRRVGIALAWYGLPFAHVPLSVFGDVDELSRFNPLRRVPTLVLDDGTCVVDSFVCLETLDELVVEVRGAHWSRLLAPRSGPSRLAILRRCGMACGATDKVVSLVYEKHFRERPSERWTERCATQVLAALQWLEGDYTSSSLELTHADVAVTCLLTFLSQTQPHLLDLAKIPGLLTLQKRCEALPEFTRVSAPFTVSTAAQDPAG